MRFIAKCSILIVGVVILAASAGVAVGNNKKSIGKTPNLGGNLPPFNPKVINNPKVIDPKIVIDPKKVVDPKLTKVIIDPKKVVDPKFVNPKVVVDPKITKIVVNPKVIVDPKKVVDPKLAKVVIDPKLVNPKVVVDPKVVKVIVNPKIVIDPKFVNPKVAKVVIDPKFSKVLVTKVIVTHVSHPPIIYLPWFGGVVQIFEILEAPAIPVQTERYLRLHNNTEEKMTVFLRNHTQDLTGMWDWVPEVPSPEATKWLAYELAPGESLLPMIGDMPVAANRIRFMVDSASQKRLSYMDEDYWLVPEMTPAGEHLYYAEGRQTYELYLGGIK